MDTLVFDGETGAYAYQSGARYTPPPAPIAMTPQQYNHLPRFTLTEWGPDDKTGGEDKETLTVQEWRELTAHLRKIRQRTSVNPSQRAKAVRKPPAGQRKQNGASAA
jgi:hypothetical protein